MNQKRACRQQLHNQGVGGREGGKDKSVFIRVKGKLPRQTTKTTFFMEVVKE